MPAANPSSRSEKSSPEARRAAFGQGLAEVLAGRGLKQADLAELLSTTQSTVSAWINGRSEPTADTVFAVEEALRLSPGFLSRLLGYLPLSAVGALPNVEEAITRSAEIDDDGRKLALAVWRTLVAKHQAFLKVVNGGTKRRTGSAKATTKAATKAAPARRRP